MCKHIKLFFFSTEPEGSLHLSRAHPGRQPRNPVMDILVSLPSLDSGVPSSFLPCPGGGRQHALCHQTEDVQLLLVLLCHHATARRNHTSLSSSNLHARLLFLIQIPAKSTDRSFARMSGHLKAICLFCHWKR